MRIFSFILLLGGFLAPLTAAAQRTLKIGVDTGLTLKQVFENILIFMVQLIPVYAVAAFMIGALMMVISRGKDDGIDKAKKLIIGSVVGMGVVLGAYAIVRTVYWFVFTL